jgi:single-stranded DNA-binding protein
MRRSRSSASPKVAGNRIELDGRLVSQLEIRVTPAGTPVLRAMVECGASGEDLTLRVVMTGGPALAAKALLEVGRPVRVIGRLRTLKGAARLKAEPPEDFFVVVAELFEPADS